MKLYLLEEKTERHFIYAIKFRSFLNLVTLGDLHCKDENKAKEKDH